MTVNRDRSFQTSKKCSKMRKLMHQNVSYATEKEQQKKADHKLNVSKYYNS